MLDFETLGLGKKALVLVDSAPIIYFIDGKAKKDARSIGRASVVGCFIEASKRGEIRLAASCLAWTECLIGISDTQRADTYRSLLSDSQILVLEPVDAAIAEEAARLLSMPNPPGFADAFHLATAVVVGASAVLTNDEAWRKNIALAAKKATPAAAGKYQALRALLVDELAFSVIDA